MIIDAHAHLWDKDWRPRWNHEGMVHSRTLTRGISRDEAEKMIADDWDPTGDKSVKEMDKSGVDIRVVVRIDYGLAVPGAENDCKVPLEEQHRITAQAAKKHQGRLIWGMSVDPRRTDALKLADLYLRELGAKALKLYPSTGFYPSDRIVYPLYEKAVQYGVPVHFHTKQAPVPMKSRYSHPMHLEDVAIDFPELKIQAVHAGGPFWWRDMLAVAEGKENIYLELSGWQRELDMYPLETYRRIREVMDRVGSERVMWATDSIYVQDNWLKSLQQIPDVVKEAGIEFTEKEVRAFMGETAAKVYGIELR